MVRATQLMHPQRDPAVPRPAATVLLLRDGPEGVEVLMTRRSPTASFAPGAYVFPGGTIDAADAQAHGATAHRPTQDGARLTQAIAAIRESFEELGVLLARHQDGRPADAADVAALQSRFSTEHIVELTAAIASYNMVARFLVALGVTPEGDAEG